MKFTLNDCVTRINQALNYPALSYEDIYHFFDQAIAELNTSLRIALPSVTEMVEDNTVHVSQDGACVRLSSNPTNATKLPHTGVKPDDANAGVGYVYVCAKDAFSQHKFYKHDGNEWDEVPKLYGMFLSEDHTEYTYIAVPITTTIAVWSPVDATRVEQFDLLDYLPMDWWTLFVIPYVCFKFAVRNGDNGALFSDEFVQGFQQLQSSYNVPNTVRLSEVAGKPAYTNLVAENLDNLGKSVFTRAIYTDMRVGNGILPNYGGLYSKGGWGL